VVYGKDAATGEAKWEFTTQGGISLSTAALDNNRAYLSPGNYDQNIYVKTNVLEKTSPVETFAIAGPQGLRKISYRKKKGGTNYIHPYQIRQLLKYSPADRKLQLDQMRQKGLQMVKFKGQTHSKSGSLKFINWTPLGGMKTSSVSVGKQNLYVIQKHLGLVETSPGQFKSSPYFILSANDKLSGQQNWQFHRVLESNNLDFASSPIVANYLEGGEVVFMGWGEGKVYALKTNSASASAAHQIFWEDKLQGSIAATPALSEGHLVFATMDGYVYQYSVDVAPSKAAVDSGIYAYPNPVRTNHDPYSKLHIDLAGSAAKVKIEIYNTAERPIVRKDVTISAGQGAYEYKWPVKNMANGVYFAKVTLKYTVGGKTEVKWVKIALLR